jgi:multicomponent Na+:H+ antiporter subunit B
MTSRSSLILRTTTRLMVPLMLLFAIFLLVRGHDDPGGGFSAGLIGAGAFALYAISFGTQAARGAMPIGARSLVGLGLAIALLAGSIPLIVGRRFLEGIWLPLTAIGFDTKLGTPLLFDLGVCFVVIGVVQTIILALEETYTPLFHER